MATERSKRKKANIKFHAKLKKFEDHGWNCCSYNERKMIAVVAKDGNCLTIVRSSVLEGCYE
jgi:hypothetical protein